MKPLPTRDEPTTGRNSNLVRRKTPTEAENHVQQKTSS